MATTFFVEQSLNILIGQTNCAQTPAAERECEFDRDTASWD